MEHPSEDHRTSRPPVIVNYVVALLSVFTALMVARVLEISLVSAPASLFLCAIMFSAWFAGIGPGVVAFVLAHLAFIYYFVTPTHSLLVEVEEVPRILIFSLSAVFVISLSVAQRSATEVLRRTNKTLENLAGRLIDAQEEERSRIGRELHDHISQTLGVLTIKIDRLRAQGEITPGVGASLDELRRDTSAITDDVHRLSHRLHSSTLDYLGLAPALQKLVAEFSERHGIAITFAQTSLPASLPSEVKLCLFRVAEEALTNIAKHSQARSANVQVTGAPDGLHLRVEDAGTGFDPTTLRTKAGLGFVSMRERLRVLHGTIHVDSAPSKGTRIDAWVPTRTSDAGQPQGAPTGELRVEARKNVQTSAVR